MNKTKLELPLRLLPDDVFLLCDGSWCLLFPDFFTGYRLRFENKRDVAKVKVIRVVQDKYLLRLMEIAPEEEKIIVPISADALQQQDLYKIHLAMALSYKKKNSNNEFKNVESRTE